MATTCPRCHGRRVIRIAAEAGPKTPAWIHCPECFVTCPECGGEPKGEWCACEGTGLVLRDHAHGAEEPAAG